MKIDLSQMNGQVLMGVAIGFLSLLSAFSAYAAKMLRGLKVTTDEVNRAVNCEPPGEGLKDSLRRLETSVNAQATVLADHASTINAAIADLSGEVSQVRGEVNALASRIITVEDKQAAYSGPDRRRGASAKKVPPKKRVTKASA